MITREDVRDVFASLGAQLVRHKLCLLHYHKMQKSCGILIRKTQLSFTLSNTELLNQNRILCTGTYRGEKGELVADPTVLWQGGGIISRSY